MSVCYKFRQLRFGQILFELVYRWGIYCKNKKGGLFLRHSVDEVMLMLLVVSGFNELSTTDQGTLIRLGQSQSRILVAALHWYDPEENNFRHFLSWRIMPPGQMDHFRQKLIDYSKRVSTLELDPIEAALLNVLVIIASGKFRQLQWPTCRKRKSSARKYNKSRVARFFLVLVSLKLFPFLFFLHISLFLLFLLSISLLFTF